jgi:Family of unknown function (DUF6404)
MTHEEKVERFEQLLRDRGYWVSNAIPPLWRLLWRIGAEVPPPYFLSFSSAFLFSGVPFGILWAVFMWITVWHGRPLPVVVVSAVIAALLFGLIMGGFWRSKSRKLRLPSWQKFPEESQFAD